MNDGNTITDYDKAVAARRDRIRARKAYRRHERLTALAVVGMVLGAGLAYLIIVGLIVAVVIAVAVSVLRFLGVL